MLYIIKKLFISLLFIVIFFAGKYIVDYVYLDQTLIYLNLRTNSDDLKLFKDPYWGNFSDKTFTSQDGKAIKLSDINILDFGYNSTFQALEISLQIYHSDSGKYLDLKDIPEITRLEIISALTYLIENQHIYVFGRQKGVLDLPIFSAIMYSTSDKSEDINQYSTSFLIPRNKVSEFDLKDGKFVSNFHNTQVFPSK